MDNSNNINLEYIKIKPNIIKVLIRSRHINSKTYKCYIEYKPNSIGYSGILRHACVCANGVRIVGSCCQIAAVIYYLSNARYKSKIIRPTKVFLELFTTSDIDRVIDEDSDEDSKYYYNAILKVITHVILSNSTSKNNSHKNKGQI